MQAREGFGNEGGVRGEVRRYYGEIARRKEGGCGCGPTSGCDDTAGATYGYSRADLASEAAAANLGLGCGNPLLFASLEPGEAVLDLGSGAGFDVFLAAERVGRQGKAVGVDMTPEMVERARRLAQRRGATNVAFWLGEIERLPIETGSIDVVISNCVINLSPDKGEVFREAFRVLRPGGRIIVSDIIALSRLPDAVRPDRASYVECVSGAVEERELRRLLEESAFIDIAFEYPRGREAQTPPAGESKRQVVSALFRALKPLDAHLDRADSRRNRGNPVDIRNGRP